MKNVVTRHHVLIRILDNVLGFLPFKKPLWRGVSGNMGAARVGRCAKEQVIHLLTVILTMFL